MVEALARRSAPGQRVEMEQPARETETRAFRPDIEGLRAVAVGLVVLSHAGVCALEGGYVGVDVFFVLSGFLITSILLKERLTRGTTSLPDFYARRVRRILPAATLVLIVTVLASYRSLGFLRGDAIAVDGEWTALFAANIHFALQGTQYLNALDPPSPLQHYWSLAVEEQFYLVWPLVLAVLAVGRQPARKRLFVVLAAIIATSFAWSVVQTGQNGHWAFFSPLTRAWELAVGASLAVSAPAMRRIPAAAGPWMGWVGLAGILASALIFNADSQFPGYAAALPVFGTALAIVAGTVKPFGGVEQILGLAPFQWAGKLSYSLYLWHWPLLVIPAQSTGNALAPEQIIGIVCVAVVLSAVTYYTVENPIRDSRWLKRRTFASLALGLAFVLTAYAWTDSTKQLNRPSAPDSMRPLATPVFAAQVRTPTSYPPLTPTRAPITVAATSTTPQLDCNRNIPTSISTSAEVPPAIPVADVLCLVASTPNIRAVPADLTPPLGLAEDDYGLKEASVCVANEEDVEKPDCVLGDSTGTRTVVLFGDSNAYMWIPALDEIGRRQHWKVVMVTKSACFPGYISILSEARKTAYVECDRWRDWAIARINAIDPDLLVVASTSGYRDPWGHNIPRDTWETALLTTLRSIAIPSAKKVVVANLPYVRIGNPPTQIVGPNCLAAHLNYVKACVGSREDSIGITFQPQSRGAAEKAGARYLDLNAWFCTPEACPPVIGQMNVYVHNGHLSATYARYLSGALQGELQPAMDAPR